MSTLSFYYPASEVIKATIFTLRSKGYKIIEMDPENRIIKARSRFHLFKGSLDIIVNINEVNSYQTNLSIESKVANAWFFNTERIKKQIENRFTSTLYHQISVGHGIN